jgi:hypothetical protein
MGGEGIRLTKSLDNGAVLDTARSQDRRDSSTSISLVKPAARDLFRRTP